MPDEQSLTPPKISLSPEQKIGFILLLIFAVFGIALGILKIRNTLYAPFALNNQVPTSLKEEVNSVDALRYRDTDADGLSDFDELYVYGTSPYLLDTFGYGISDKEVLAKGLPLCPKGQNCVGAPSETLPVISSSPSVAVPGLEGAPTDLIQQLKDPTQVRQMLLEAGVSKDMLGKIDDATLMLMVSQLLSATSTADNLQSINNLINQKN